MTRKITVRCIADGLPGWLVFALLLGLQPARVSAQATAAPSGGGTATGPSSSGSAGQSTGSASSSQGAATSGGGGAAAPVPGANDGFQGSVPEGTATSTPVALTFLDAINRGLRNNLGLLTSEQSSRQSIAQRIRSLSALLPSVSGQVSEAVEQVNLATVGIRVSSQPNSPVKIPEIAGPFSFGEAQALASIPIFNLQNIRNLQSARRAEAASAMSVKDARDLVVQAVANAYLQIIASAARVDATGAAVRTAQTSYDRAVNQRQAGTSPGIDVLRAQVELRRQQQTLLSQTNDLAKNKLTLGRTIGLPIGQEFVVADPTPSVPLEAGSLPEALRQAYASRSDVRAAELQLNAAEFARRAAQAQWIPQLNVSGFYGDSGQHLFTQSHGVFSVQGALTFNIFTGGRIRADVVQRDADLRNRRNELANLRSRVDYEVRTAFLDLRSSQDQVNVARENVTLATQELTQSNDRFAAGVTDNLEVVQAQQSLADANQNLISALYQNNLAKVELARALGLAEEGIRTYFASGKGVDPNAAAPKQR